MFFMPSTSFPLESLISQMNALYASQAIKLYMNKEAERTKPSSNFFYRILFILVIKIPQEVIYREGSARDSGTSSLALFYLIKDF